ncbi:MAG: ABC transporter ATP-binding protein [Dehalococcoidia bacterium]
MSIAFDARMKLGGFQYEAAFDAANEIVVLFGHSGAGKSVTLQVIAGLMRPREGRVEISGRPVFDSEANINLAPQERHVGYVVQDLALFPHMTVAKNVEFGIPEGTDKARRCQELLELLHIAELAERRPSTLSGGQRQRVALARALARDANVLLLDEPFSALDDALRVTLRRELLRLRAELGLTIVFVTHDLREAHLLADRLAVFDEGRVLQFGPREEVFRRPLSRRVAELTGTSNIFRATVRELGQDGELQLEIGGARFAANSDLPAKAGEVFDVAIRAERVNLRRPGEVPNAFRAVLVEEFAFGSSHTLHFKPLEAGPPVEVEIASRPYEVLGVEMGQEWLLELPPSDLWVMRRE